MKTGHFLSFYVSVSLVLWSGNHLDGRKIGHCKLKLDNLIFFFLLCSINQTTHPLLSPAVYVFTYSCFAHKVWQENMYFFFFKNKFKNIKVKLLQKIIFFI